MKRIIRITLSLPLCAALLLCAVFPAGAVMALLWQVGDADMDYDITIKDATTIQRYLAGFSVNHSSYSDELIEALADADGSGTVSILDATTIQRHLADLPCSFKYRELSDVFVGDTGFHSTADIYAPGADGSRAIGYVGVPVDFTARLLWGNPPQTFRLRVNGETIWERAANGERKCEFTCTFDAEGDYDVQLDVICKYGVSKSFRRIIDVRSLPEDDRPVIMGATYFDQTWMSSGNDDLTITAAGGTGPYTYSYTVYYARSPIYDIWADDGQSLTVDEGDEPAPVTALIGKAVRTGYIAKDTINPPQMMQRFDRDAYEDLYICVTVRDAEGMVSDPVTAVCYQYQAYM